MIDMETAIHQVNAAAEIFGGTWYLAATPYGWLRTSDKAEAAVYGILHTAVGN